MDGFCEVQYVLMPIDAKAKSAERMWWGYRVIYTQVRQHRQCIREEDPHRPMGFTGMVVGEATRYVDIHGKDSSDDRER